MDGVSKSWFCVFNNPEEHGYKGTPEEIVDKMISVWIEDNPQRSCAIAYCVSEKGLKHCHAVLEDTKAMRFTAVKKLYPAMHIEPTKGNKGEAENYINKRGKFEETGEKIIYINQHGDIKGAQGSRRDLSIIEDLINQGKTPDEIFETSFSFRRYDKMIRDAFFHNRKKLTPIKRELKVVYHVGQSGSGKSYSMLELIEKHGEDDVYIVTDYENGFDKYNGERIIFMDEFRGQIPFAQLLTLIDGYKVQVKARYTNVYSLWSEVHITSVMPPEKLYEKMVSENRNIDTKEQLMRRITDIVYHYKKDGEYKKATILCKNYKDIEALQKITEDYHDWTANIDPEELDYLKTLL